MAGNEGIVRTEVKITEETVGEIIRQRVMAGIADALGGNGFIIEKLVDAAVNMKVDETGKRSQYDSSNKYTFVEALTRQMIQQAAQEACREWVSNNKKLVTEAFLKQLNKSKSAMATSFVDGLAKAIDSSWMFSVSVNLNQKD